MNATEVQRIPTISDTAVSLFSLVAHARQLGKIAAEFGIAYMSITIRADGVAISAAADTDNHMRAFYNALIADGAASKELPRLVSNDKNEWLSAEVRFDDVGISFYGPHRAKPVTLEAETVPL
jgi:hypothetical protein